MAYRSYTIIIHRTVCTIIIIINRTMCTIIYQITVAVSIAIKIEIDKYLIPMITNWSQKLIHQSYIVYRSYLIIFWRYVAIIPHRMLR